MLGTAQLVAGGKDVFSHQRMRWLGAAFQSACPWLLSKVRQERAVCVRVRALAQACTYARELRVCRCARAGRRAL